MTQIIDCPPQKPEPVAPQPDFTAIKARQRSMWASGDFAIIGGTLQIVGESLCEAVDLAAGSRVLDVACGSGNASLAAARRFCQTTGVDYVSELLARARERAAAERLEIDFVEGDAENLPFADSSFDVVLSTYGVMFAPNQARAASELLRVCAPGGSIGLANWTPQGFLGDLFAVVSRYVPPAAPLASPLAWGTQPRLHELFGAHARSIRTERKHFIFRYRSPEHFIEVFRTYYGPTRQSFAALDAERQKALAADIEQLLVRLDRKAGQALAVPGEYLEVVIEKR